MRSGSAAPGGRTSPERASGTQFNLQQSPFREEEEGLNHWDMVVLSFTSVLQEEGFPSMLSTVGIQVVTEGGRYREEVAGNRVGGPVGHVMGVGGGEGRGTGHCFRTGPGVSRVTTE